MAVETAVAGGDWSTPATRGELLSVKRDLQMALKGLRVEMKDVQLDIFRMMDCSRSPDCGGVLPRFF